MPSLWKWQGITFELSLQNWLWERGQEDYRAFPFILAWGIWITRNGQIFQDEPFSAERVAVNCIGIFQSFLGSGRETVAPLRDIREVEPDSNFLWGYFDGASSSDQTICGGGGCLHFTHAHYFTLKAGLGPGTNNYSELMALKLLLLFAIEQGCRTLQVFGDSLVIINWINGKHRCQVSHLLPLLEDVMCTKNIFDTISFSHIYRERNQLADRLSKEATQLDYGQWYVVEFTPAGT
jgi:ribonuclease HI